MDEETIERIKNAIIGMADEFEELWNAIETLMESSPIFKQTGDIRFYFKPRPTVREYRNQVIDNRPMRVVARSRC